VVLEGVNDHENLGSIFRNAAGLGVDAVVFGMGCADPLYRRAVRVSMGHALLVPYAWTEAWPHDLQILRDNGFRLLAMTPDASAHTLGEAMAEAADDKAAILVGGRGAGADPNGPCVPATCGCEFRCRGAPTRSTSRPLPRSRSTNGLGSRRD
jgi:tRNA G18 (ribose-2'-O)-methylase SpoU